MQGLNPERRGRVKTLVECQTRLEKGKQRLGVGGHSALDVWQVSMSAPDNTDMLGGSNKLDTSIVDADG